MNINNDIGINIKQALEENGKDQQWLAEKMSVTQSTVSLWLNNKRTPRMAKIQDIADALNTTTDRILFGLDNYITKMQLHDLPVYGTASCGNGVMNDDCITDYLNISDFLFRGDEKEYFIIRADGDSMIGANIPNGAYLLFKRTPELSTGQIGTFSVGNGEQALVKRYMRYGDQIVLRSENPNYEDIVIDDDATFKIVGQLKKIIIDVNGI